MVVIVDAVRCTLLRPHENIIRRASGHFREGIGETSENGRWLLQGSDALIKITSQTNYFRPLKAKTMSIG